MPGALSKILISIVTFTLIFWMIISHVINRRPLERAGFLDDGSRAHFLKEAEDRAAIIYAKNRLCEKLSSSNFLEFGHRLRLFAQVFQDYESFYGGDRGRLRELQDAQRVSDGQNGTQKEQKYYYQECQSLWKMENSLFPWARGQFSTLLELKSWYGGKGIVIPTGSHHFRFAVHLIRQIRILGSKLPIMVAYSGINNDLKAEELGYLGRLGVGTIDVSIIFETKELELGGWQIKPFALLAAPFEEVILADADVVFLQNPDVVLEDEGYKEFGALIYHDRTLFPDNQGNVDWLEKNLPHPLSEKLLSSRMYKKVSSHEQESGVVVWNKQKCFFGLLATCKMNSKQEREKVTYSQFYGDKESFWIGLEMAGQTYTEMQPVPGVIGDSRYDQKKQQLVACGRILHFDRTGRPLWFNGAIVENKREEAKLGTIMNFTHYAREGSWDFESSCLDEDVTAIDAPLKSIIDRHASMWTNKINYDAPIDDYASIQLGNVK